MSQETWTPAPVLKPCKASATNAEVDTVLRRVWMWHFRQECASGPDAATPYAIVRRRVLGALSANLKHGLGQTLPGAE